VRQGKLGPLSERLVALLDGVARPPAVTRNGQYLKRLAIKAGGRVTILGVKDIDWIEAEGDYVKIHSGRAWHLLRETMKHLETQFDPARFVRIHRSTIVNVERIKELQPYFRGEYTVILHDGTSLKLSRGYKEHLEAALAGVFDRFVARAAPFVAQPFPAGRSPDNVRPLPCSGCSWFSRGPPSRSRPSTSAKSVRSCSRRTARSRCTPRGLCCRRFATCSMRT